MPTVVPDDSDGLTDLVSELAGKHRVPGAQFALRHGRGTVSVAVGSRRHPDGAAVTAGCAFPAGSLGKSFTAALAMVLVADGDLALDEPVGDHLPELGRDSACARLTLRQLLSHTGGLPSSPETEPGASDSPRRYVRAHCRQPELVLQPGTGFSYSNVGYVLTGRLIEHVTGMTWWDAMESIVLRPLGIEPAFVSTPDGRRPGRDLATGHAVNLAACRIRPVEQSLSPAEAPAGALALSAEDLVTFATALLGTAGPATLLSPHDAELMRQPVVGADPFGMADDWGLGLALFRHRGREWAGHDGTGDGTWCHLRFDPGSGTVLALTTNASTGVGMWDDLVARLRAADIPVGTWSGLDVPAQSTSPPPGCLGDYTNGDVEYSVRSDDRGHLFLAIDGDPHAWLTVHDSLTFSLRDMDSGQSMYAGRFLPDPETGSITQIQITGRLARRC